jgi:hypothetical protein
MGQLITFENRSNRKAGLANEVTQLDIHIIKHALLYIPKGTTVDHLFSCLKTDAEKTPAFPRVIFGRQKSEWDSQVPSHYIPRQNPTINYS